MAYNGWTNYATWRVNLELFDGLDLTDFFDSTPDLSTCADFCQSFTESTLETTGRGLALDYAMAFISDVNWQEIASHLLED